ncbi:2Fe-2S iron-sulfur cluster-binding protein [Streptomyces sp. BBFR2]|uniref:2Fe-2S iron-sulfur cluster-binding protein n=1 Tax=Streptomyces sp. BBFR2 TaxID=3372854 RepID=UPI0037D9E914
MSDDNRRPQPEQGWQPLPQGGEYEQEATAFVQLPEGFTTAALGGGDYYQPGADPLAAPGHGYVPPATFTPPIPGAGTDPSATGQWTMPFADPSAGYADPSAGYPDRTGQEAGPTGTPPHGTPWGGDHVEWPVAGGTDAVGGTGQWAVPGAPDDVLEESGEYLVDDGRTAPHGQGPTGGYPATGYRTGYDPAAPGGDTYTGQDLGHPAPDPYGYAPSGDTYGGQGGYGGHPLGQDPLFGGISEDPYPQGGAGHGLPQDTAHGTGDAYGAQEAAPPVTPGGGSGHWSLPADALAQWPPADPATPEAPAPETPGHLAEPPADTASWTVPTAAEQPDVSGEFPLDAVRDGAYGTYSGYGAPVGGAARPDAAETAHTETAHAPGEQGAPASSGLGADTVPEPAAPAGEPHTAPDERHLTAEPFVGDAPYATGEPQVPQADAGAAGTATGLSAEGLPVDGLPADGLPAAGIPGAPGPESGLPGAPGAEPDAPAHLQGLGHAPGQGPGHAPDHEPVHAPGHAPVHEPGREPVAAPGTAVHGTPPHGVPVPEAVPAAEDTVTAVPVADHAATGPEAGHPEDAPVPDPGDVASPGTTDGTGAAGTGTTGAVDGTPEPVGAHEVTEAPEAAPRQPGDDGPSPAAPGQPETAAPEGPEDTAPETAGHETAGHETAAPHAPAPGTAVPDAVALDASAPDSAPDMAAPDPAVPDAAPQVLPHSGPDTAGADAYAEEHPHASYVLRVNGADRPVTDAWIGESLLYVLRERLGLAGAKDGCSQGECGACSVQVDGRLVASCLVPAATTAGSEVRTVEGLAEGGRPSDVQRALAESGAVQCGFCIPGMAMTVHDLLEGNHAPSELETRQALCGNLCRCSGYRGVLDAVDTVVTARQKAAEAAAEAEAPEGAAHIPHQAGPAEPAPQGAHEPGPHAPDGHGGAPGHDPDEPHGPDAPHRTGGPA